MLTLEQIYNMYPNEEFMCYGGFEDAVVGVYDSTPKRLILSSSKCLLILMDRYGLDYELALEDFHFNVTSAYIGEQTPLFVDDLDEDCSGNVIDYWELLFGNEKN